MDDTLYEYIGAIHIHSVFSDGRGTIEKIAEIGGAAELDFLLFSDHMTLEPLKLGLEGWYGNTLVLIGYEINDQDDKNHYLAFDLKDTLPDKLSAPEYVKAVRALGGIGFIAHPDEMRTLPSLPPYPWTEWDVEGYDGIEIWNHSSEWVERLKPYLLFTLRHLMSPRSGLKGPPEITLARWDQLNLQRRVAGIGGTDAHEHVFGWHFISIRIFPYKLQFKAIHTHVLLDSPLSSDLQISKKAVYAALVNGRAFVSNLRWGNAKGFRFWASHGDTTHRMGARVPYRPGMRFHIQVPKKARIALLRNGVKYASTKGLILTVPVDAPGAYRVEVRRWHKPWIFSNHIVILEAARDLYDSIIKRYDSME